MARPRTSTRKYMPSNAHVGMALLNGDELIKQLEALEFQVREKVAVEAIEAAMRPVQAAVLANTPESRGSREKQSTKTKAKWSGAKKTEINDSIRGPQAKTCWHFRRRSRTCRPVIQRGRRAWESVFKRPQAESSVGSRRRNNSYGQSVREARCGPIASAGAGSTNGITEIRHRSRGEVNKWLISAQH